MWRLLRRRKRNEPDDHAQHAQPGSDHAAPGADATSEESAPTNTERAIGGSSVAAAKARSKAADGSSSLSQHDTTEIDYAIDHQPDPAAADEAPEPVSEGLLTQTRERPLLRREDIIEDALNTWAQQVSAEEENASFLSHMRDGRPILDLSQSHPSGLAQLLAGRGPTRLSSLVREVGALADARAHARHIRETAERFAEDMGLATCHLGIGEVSWQPLDGSAPIHAPVLLRPLTLRLRGNSREDVDLDLDATAELNPVLLRALRDAGVALDARALLDMTAGPHGFDPNPVLETLYELGEPLPGFTVSHALVVGNVLDTARSVASDLAENREAWIQHPVVAALAGTSDAVKELRDATSGPVDLASVPETEAVAAVDEDQRTVLAHVLAGHHVSAVIPPGSDGNDVVVNLTAELNSRGRSVLVVSQRRRNLEELLERAEARGVRDLVCDLSPDPSQQRNASADLLASMRSAGSHGFTTDTTEPDDLARTRDILSGHVEAMHRMQQPWGCSAHDAMGALAALTSRTPAPTTTVRLRPDVAEAMLGGERERYAEALRNAADVGVFSAGPEKSAWFGAAIASTSQAERAEHLVTQLREDVLPALQRAADRTGTEIGLKNATSIPEMTQRLKLLTEVQDVLSGYQRAVFQAPLADLIAATADKKWRENHSVHMGIRERRRLVRHARSLQRPTAVITAEHEALQQAHAVHVAWKQSTGEREALPHVPDTFDRATAVTAQAQRLLDELAVLLEGTRAAENLHTCSFDEIQRRLHALDADRADLKDLPQRTTVVRQLTFDGLGELVEDLRVRRVSAEHVADELELSWWSTVIELIAGAEPMISQYDGTSLSQVAERFRKLDAQWVGGSSDRIRAAVDDRLVKTMKAYPDTSRAAIAELTRASTVSIRDVAAKYEDVVFRARPTWLASPYLVPQVLPPGEHFDVVIIADGGHLPVAAALPSIVRARHVVVVGDPLEYSADGTSVLDAMVQIAPHVEILHETRPAAEGVRLFAQRRALAAPVRHVPGPAPMDPDELVEIVDARGAITVTSEYVESSEAELRRVTDLVIDHACSRPERSLAVFALTHSHARRLAERIFHTVSVVPALRDFFSADNPEPFVVTSVDNAAAIRRDDAVFSLGFGKTPHGRLLHRFGPLSESHGRHALATVLTRARGRTTVVTGISPEDLDTERLRTDGARDLHALLWMLRGAEDVPVVPRITHLVEHEGGDDSEQTTCPECLEALISGETSADGSEANPSEPESTARDSESTARDSGSTARGTVPTRFMETRSVVPVRAVRPGAKAADAVPLELSDDDLDAAIAAELAKVDDGQGDDQRTEQGADDPREVDVRDADAARDADGARDADAAESGEPAQVAETSKSDVSTQLHDPAESEELAGRYDPAESEDALGFDEFADVDDDMRAGDPSAPRKTSSTLETDALVGDLAERLQRMGLSVERDFGAEDDRIELAVGHPELPGRFLLAVDTDGERYVATTSQRERDRLRAERLEAVGWATERVWSWALFIDPEGEAQRIRRSLEQAFTFMKSDESLLAATGVGTIKHRLPRPQIPAGHPLSFYSSEDFDAVVEYICSDGRARLEDQLASEVRAFLGFEKRSVLLDVAVASAIHRYQERQ